jgi:hypothetical protein
MQGNNSLTCPDNTLSWEKLHETLMNGPDDGWTG